MVLNIRQKQTGKIALITMVRFLIDTSIGVLLHSLLFLCC